MSQSIYKQFWKYTLPTVAAMLVNGLYQVVDGIFIGQYMGADGLAGINIAWPVIGSVMGIGMMVGVGTGAIASINQGAGSVAKARATMSTWTFVTVNHISYSCIYTVAILAAFSFSTRCYGACIGFRAAIYGCIDCC